MSRPHRRATRAESHRANRHSRPHVTRSGRPNRPGTYANSAGNYHGIHLLRSRQVVRGLLESAAVGPGDLVLDLGAGPGTLTGALADTGARILAVERDPDFVARLHRRFGDRPEVRVVPGDLRDIPLPRRPFQVVASIPYALSTLLVRRLLSPPHRPLRAADLVVEWGFGKRIAAPYGRDLEAAWWGARFDIRVVRRVSSAAFRPRPRVDSAHLTIRPRNGVGSRRTLRALHALLVPAYADPGRSLRGVLAGTVPRSAAARIAATAGLSPSTTAGQVGVAEWGELARLLSAERASQLPALPRSVELVS
jgi:23S rRNA (adenine-N6)-dimethyltransferase